MEKDREKKTENKREMKRFHQELIRMASAHRKYNVVSYLEMGLTTGMPKILFILSEKEGYLQKDMAKICGIEPATLTTLLASMVEKDLVWKKTLHVSGGKRAFGLYLTDHGREVSKEVCRIIDESEVKSFEGFTPEEKLTFMEMMNRISENLGAED